MVKIGFIFICLILISGCHKGADMGLIYKCAYCKHKYNVFMIKTDEALCLKCNKDNLKEMRKSLKIKRKPRYDFKQSN